MTGQKRRSRRSWGSVEVLGSGRFRARYPGPDGRVRSAPVTFGSRGEAEDYLAGVRADLLRGQWEPPERAAVTLAQYAETWQRHRAPQLRARTRALHAANARRWLLAPLGSGRGRVHLAEVSLSAITPALVREWWAALVTATYESAAARITARPARRTHPARAWARIVGMTVPDTGRLPSEVLTAWQAAGSPDPAPVPEVPETAGRTTASQAYRLLHAILEQAVTDGLITTNPARIPGAAHADHAERLPLSVPEVGALAAAVPEDYRAAVLLASWSGLRPGEVFALTVRDFDPGAGVVTVRHTLTEVPGQPATLGPPKTSAARRTVALPAFVTEAMSAHLAAHPPTRPDGLIFTTGTGGPVSASRRAQVMGRARATIGRPDITWHHLRHTGATLAAQAGATTAELQHRIGHASPRAAAIYQHASTHRDTQLAQHLHTLATEGTMQ